MVLKKGKNGTEHHQASKQARIAAGVCQKQTCLHINFRRLTFRCSHTERATFHQFPSSQVRHSHLFLADLSVSHRAPVAAGWKNTAVTPPSDIQFPPRHRAATPSLFLPRCLTKGLLGVLFITDAIAPIPSQAMIKPHKLIRWRDYVNRKISNY